MAIWTQREWRLVAAALPADVDRPTPKQLDAAQRAALPADRWRTRQSMYGTDAAIDIKLNVAAARAQIPDYKQTEAEVHAQRRKEEHEELARRLHMDRMYRPKFTAPALAEPAPAADVTRGNSSTSAGEPHIKVHVVGLVGQQTQRVREEISRRYGPGGPPGLALVFIEANSARRALSLAGGNVVCTRFIDRNLHAAIVKSARRCAFAQTANPKTIAGHVVDLFGDALLDQQDAN